MVAVASLLALRYESIVIGLLGVIGAFISPVLLGPELSDLRLLGLYILLVDLGVLGISTFRNWRWFTLVGWVGFIRPVSPPGWNTTQASILC